MTAAEEEGAVPFNGFEGQPIEWADIPEPPPQIEWTDTTYAVSLSEGKR
jgi:PAB-dependent poly(A)-specific ribonuclease subunit 2